MAGPLVESISRLGRKTLDILSIIQQFEETGIQFISLKENMDTRTPTGKAMLQMMCVIAELERNLIALRMYDSKEYSIKEIVEGTGIS